MDVLQIYIYAVLQYQYHHIHCDDFTIYLYYSYHNLIVMQRVIVIGWLAIY